ncbi:hypothetical protein A6A27_13270 [Micromonospora sp. CB01531]|nr:hypothetical protein A6A27_13270 [Micromonospora sp. CB01531]
MRDVLGVGVGAGLGLLRVGFGVGLGLLVVALGLGDLVVAVGLGDSVVAVGLSESETAGSAMARSAEADGFAAGLSSSGLPMAARPPPQQHSRASPRKPKATFCPEVTRRFGPLSGTTSVGPEGVRQPCCSFPAAAGSCAVGSGGTASNWAVGGW